MKVRWFGDPEIVARTDTDQPGRCVVTWEGRGDQGIRCYGWIEGDKLFLPSDGDGLRESDFTPDGKPSRDAYWYECSTGKDAIYGIPGSTLCIIE